MEIAHTCFVTPGHELLPPETICFLLLPLPTTGIERRADMGGLVCLHKRVVRSFPVGRSCLLCAQPWLLQGGLVAPAEAARSRRRRWCWCACPRPLRRTPAPASSEARGRFPRPDGAANRQSLMRLQMDPFRE
eukprot:1103602-Pleurochrysis_carterae.AAC.2